MNRYQTQWAAQFAVASELCKRGYDLGFTVGNQTPDADILAISPISKSPIMIDVKGMSGVNFWRIREKEPKPGLFYVLAVVPTDKANRFFIMSEADVRREQASYRTSGVKFDAKHAGFNWSKCLPFENRWDTLLS